MASMLVSCGSKETDTAAIQSDDELPVVDIDVAHTRAVDLIRSYTANVEADNINNIAPSMSNRIRNINVDVGARVSK